MNIYGVLESLQREVHESKPLPWPLQEKSVIDRERLLKILERTRDSLPEDVKQARWLTRETERIAAESVSKADRVVRHAQSKSRDILRAAEDEVTRLISQQEVVAKAREEAQRILEEARLQAQRVREEADQYARDTREDADCYALKVLNGMQDQLQQIMTVVKRGQSTLLGDRP